MAVNIRSDLVASGNHLCLSWIHGHSGVLGNERADALAKSAAVSNMTISYYTLSPMSNVRKRIRYVTLLCPNGTDNG